MGTPYSKEYIVTTTGVNEIVPLDYPGRIELTRLAVTRIGASGITLDMYSRAFTSDTVDIVDIIDDGDGNTQIRTSGNFTAARVGDILTVASNAVGGYNTSHRVTAILDTKNIVTDQTYSADGLGGTVKLNIPAAEQPLYKVIAQLTSAGADIFANLSDSDVVLFVNMDPRPNANIGVNRKIYAKLAAAGTYKLMLTGQCDVAGEG